MDKSQKEKLLGLYPEYKKVHGPYLRDDGRKHVVLNNTDLSKGTKGKLRTISLPKALVEIELNERLNDQQTIDHRDRDKTNDSLDNLKILDRHEHAKSDALHVVRMACSCVGCGSFMIPTRSQGETCSTKAGPFCSRKCSGTYGARVQKTGETITRTEIEKIYVRPSKEIEKYE